MFKYFRYSIISSSEMISWTSGGLLQSGPIPLGPLHSCQFGISFDYEIPFSFFVCLVHYCLDPVSSSFLVYPSFWSSFLTMVAWEIFLRIAMPKNVFTYFMFIFSGYWLGVEPQDGKSLHSEIVRRSCLQF